MRIISLSLAIAFLLTGCGSGGDNIKITAGGATFPYPLYDKMFREYKNDHNVRINYQSIGSGGGIRQLENKTLDFGASDAFLREEKMKNLDKQVLHIPTCIGAVTVAYNLKGVEDLKLTPDIIADIALGKITNWNNNRIKKINPNKDLPDQKIVFVHRSDGSGTNFIFTEYLSKTDSTWRKKVGKGKTVNWPTGIGAKGNEGVTNNVKQQVGRVGYVEFSYAIQSGLSTAKIRNKSGNYIKPSVESASKAANVQLPDDTRVMITNTAAPQGYPLAGFTWLLIYKEQAYNNRGKEKVEAILNLMWWMIHDGQKFAKDLHYAPLADAAVKKAESVLQKVTYKGKPVLEKGSKSANKE